MEFTAYMTEYSNLIGKTTELNQILRFVEDEENCGSCLYLEGSNGIGKSHLLSVVKDKLDSGKVEIVEFRCDKLIRKNFYPLKFYLRDYFGIPDIGTDQEKLITWQTKKKNLLHLCENKELLLEFDQTENYLIDFIVTEKKENKIDPELYFQNIFFALINLFRIISDKKKLSILIDDANYLDHDSVKFLQALTKAGIDFVLILSCTSNKDGTTFTLDLNCPKKRIYLFPLNEEEIGILLENTLNPFPASIPEKTRKFVYTHSKGIPLKAEQLIKYLKQNNLIHNDYELKYSDIPGDPENLMRHNLNNLPQNLRELSNTASVLGNRFSLRLMEAMLPAKNVDKLVEEGKKEKLWFAISEIDNSFYNLEIRDAVYRNIVQEELKKIHKTAAEALLKIYPDNAEYYPEIAMNYFQAEEYREAWNYFEKAAEDAKLNYHYHRAVEYYQKLLIILEKKQRKHQKEKDEILLNLIEIYLNMSATEKAETELNEFGADRKDLPEKYHYLKIGLFIIQEEYQMVKEYSETVLDQIQNPIYAAEIRIAHCRASSFLNDDSAFEDEAHCLIEDFKKKGKTEFLVRMNHNLGIYHFNKAEYSGAKKIFQENFELLHSQNNKSLLQKTMNLLGVIHSRLGDRKKAKKYYEQALLTAGEIGNRNACSKILSNLATIATNDGKYDRALEYYEKALQISAMIGNRLQEEIVLYGIGDIYCRLQDYERSIKYVMEAENICKSIADKTGLTYVNDLYGDILFSQERFAEAKEIYWKNLQIQEELNDPEGISHTLGNLGNVAKMEQDYDKAEEFYRAQQEKLVIVGDLEGEGKAWFNWAMIDVEKGQPEKAVEKLQNAIELFEKCSYKDGSALARDQLAQIR